MNDLRIALRLAAGFALMAALTAAVGLRGLDGVDDALKAMDSVASTQLPAVKALADLRYNLRSLAVAERNLLIPDFQARDSVRANVAVYKAQAEQALRRYAALEHDALSRERFEAFLRARAAWQAVDARQAAHLEAWEADRANESRYRQALDLMERSGRAANLEMMDALAALIDAQGQAAAAVQERAMEHSRGDRGQLVLLLAAAVVLGAAACWLLARSIVRPLGRCVDFARAVEQGRLDRTLDVSGQDETGRLAESLRAMVSALQAKIEEAEDLHEHALRVAETARQAQAAEALARADAERARLEGQLDAAARLQDIVEAVTSASDELARQVEHSSTGARTQARRVAEAATAMEQMAAAVVEVARGAGQAASTSESARRKAGGGARRVERVLEAIRRVEQASAGLKEDMRQLGQRAQGIGQVMEVISDIADQTNLLALNAAIEAARAGDAGRGFAVVADEVRKLAEKTMNATREVGQVIQGIQQSTARSEAGMDAAVDLIREATSEADGSGRALGEIVALVDDACGRIQAIAAASEQQSAATEQISRTMEDIHRVSEDTSSAMSQSAQAVNLLAAQASDLMLVIGGLREAEHRPALAA